MLDFVIKNASVYDGTGAKPNVEDVFVKDGKITHIGRYCGENTKELIDGSGKLLAPGFIDIHCHSDQSLHLYPLAQSRILQGVTTEIAGNCGMSAAPLRQEKLELLRAYMGNLDYCWESFGEYLQHMESDRHSVNFGCGVGHGTLRIAAMGFENREPELSELQDMKALLRHSLSEGAFALSSGLIYPPGSYASGYELSELAKELVPFGAFYETHMRNEGTDILNAMNEAVDVCRNSGAPLHISHHKIIRKTHWGLSEKTVEMIKEWRAQGLDVTADQYPYVASATYLSSNVPAWAFEGGIASMIERLKDPITRAKAKEEANLSHEGRWEDIYIGFVKSAANQWMIGKSLREIADLKGSSPCDVCFDIIVLENNEASEINYGMSEEDIEHIMKQDFVMIGSDGYAYSLDVPGLPHPRCYGTFPRVIAEYSRNRRLFSPEKAIHKMTGMPAQRLGLMDRGYIKEGMWADLVLFDYESLQDNSSYANPKQGCSGIHRVYVNGVLTAKDGIHTGATSGKILRRG